MAVQKKMNIRAKFIGADSLGYTNGQVYSILLKHIKGKTIISRIDGTGICAYSSAFSFLKNWDEINSTNHK